MKGSGIICFLSDLEIPIGKVTREHYYPKSHLPSKIYSMPFNIVPAHKIINNIKGDLLPCQWEQQKINLSYIAIKKYHITNQNRLFLKLAIDNWQFYKINPYKYCIATKFKEYSINNR